MKAVLMGILFFCMSLNIAPAFSQENVSDKQTVNNKICPVCGDNIGTSKDEESATVEYEGKVYNLCGTHCIEEFNKDPKKYIQKIEDEMKGSSTSGHVDQDHLEQDHVNHNDEKVSKE